MGQAVTSEIILKEINGEILTSSRDVADRFKKKHAEVMYAIEGRVDSSGKVKNNGLLMSGNSQLSNLFNKVEYLDSMNRTKYEYLMNRDGFSLLAMGFTGKEALEWKLKYIEAFNKMEDALKKQVEKALPTTYKEALQQLLEQVEQNELLLEKNEKLEPLARFAEHVTESSNAIDIGEFSKVVKNEVIDIGRNRLFKWLRDKKFLMSNNVPYQRYVDNDWFRVIELTKETSYGVKCFTKTLITGKGQVQILEKIREDFIIEE